MKELSRNLVASIACAALLLAASPFASAESPPPSYVVVQPPAFWQGKHHVTGYYPGHPVPVSQHAYAYGWFGVSGVRPQKMRHNGYRNDYSQWSFR